MNYRSGREPRTGRSRQTTQRNPQRGSPTYGTDFRHAVEFSRSGRSRHPAGWAFDRGGCSTLRRSLCPSSGGSRTRARRSERRHPGQPTSPGWCSRGPLGCWAGGAWSDPRGGNSVPVPLRSGRAHGESYVGVVQAVKPARGDARHPSGPAPSHAAHTVQPRWTPATERLPRRSTSQPPGSQSDSPGTASASVTRSLFR